MEKNIIIIDRHRFQQSSSVPIVPGGYKSQQRFSSGGVVHSFLEPLSLQLCVERELKLLPHPRIPPPLGRGPRPDETAENLRTELLT